MKKLKSIQTSRKRKLAIRTFSVTIPNERGFAAAYQVHIKVPVELRDGLELMTPEGHHMIETTKLWHVSWIRDVK